MHSCVHFHQKQQGMSLAVVLMLLTITMVLGIGAVQISLMGERSARNDRDYQIAWQASEAGLMDAEFDIDPKNSGTSTRSEIFSPENALAFLDGCGDSGNSLGLCMPTTSGKPVWLEVDLDELNGRAVKFGKFTGRTFDSGNTGLKPAQAPQYIIELIDDTAARGDASIGREKKYVYRITSIGFGPRNDIQAVTQSIFRK